MSINSAAFRLGGAIVIPLLSVGVIHWDGRPHRGSWESFSSS